MFEVSWTEGGVRNHGLLFSTAIEGRGDLSHGGRLAFVINEGRLRVLAASGIVVERWVEGATAINALIAS